MSTSCRGFSLKHLVAALVASAALIGCGGPMQEAGDELSLSEQNAVQEALQAPVVADPSQVTATAMAGPTAAQTAQANVPDRAQVADSQDPIPIKPDDRPISGNNPTPPSGGGDPAASVVWVPQAHAYLRR